jgi:hypothetical protein
VISPQQATGVVEVVEGLHLVQDKTYDVPTVLVAHQVCTCVCVHACRVLATSMYLTCQPGVLAQQLQHQPVL